MKTKMIKKNVLPGLVLMILVGLTTGNVLAQPGRGMKKGPGFGMKHMGDPEMCRLTKMLELTDEQQEKVKALKLDFMKENLSIKNQLNVKRAELKAMQAQERVNMSEVNGKIDEITELTGDMMKAVAELHQEIREELTEDQRLLFDSHPLPERFKGPFHGKEGMKGFDRPYPNCPFRSKWDDDKE